MRWFPGSEDTWDVYEIGLRVSMLNSLIRAKPTDSIGSRHLGDSDGYSPFVV